MKKLLKKLGFRKMDEMEQHIAFKAQRNAYVFLIIALLIWSLYESYKVFVFHTSLDLLPCMLLTAASSIQVFSQLLLASDAVKNDEDSQEASPFLRIIICACVIASILVTAGAAAIIMGTGA